MKNSQLIDRYFELKDKFEYETDRGVAILICSYLDILLESLLKQNMKKSKITDNLFKGYGPLSTLSSKIDICYALGNFDEMQYKELSIIRKIRNRFAHELDDISFEHEKVENICKSLAFCKDIELFYQEINTARQRYIYSTSCLVCEIDLSIQKNN